MSAEEKVFNQISYQNSYNKEKYDRISLMLPKGEKDRIKTAAVAAGESVNEFINKAIKQRIDHI
jgi:predicted HicB family RNase H-like nuclease